VYSDGDEVFGTRMIRTQLLSTEAKTRSQHKANHG